MTNARPWVSLALCSILLGCPAAGDDTDGVADELGTGDANDASDVGDTAADTSTTQSDTTTGEGCDSTSPYMGGWEIGCCQDEAMPSAWYPGGVGPGSVIPDWTFIDQFGESVRIRDFCHEAIYFDYAAMWCGACQVHAPELEALYTEYKDRGLLSLTYMSESNDSGPATQADVQAWASTYAITGIVAYSSLQDVWFPFGVDLGGGNYSIALPGTMLLGPGGAIAKIGIPTIEEIELALPPAE